MSLGEIIDQTKSSRLRKRLQSIVANYNSNTNNIDVVIDDCTKAVSKWARNAYQIRLLFSILSLGLYPLIHLFVTAVGRLLKSKKYQDMPLNCTQVPIKQAQTIKLIIIDAIKVSLSEQSNLSTFCQQMKGLIEADPRGQSWQPLLEHLDTKELQYLAKTAHVASQRTLKYTPNDENWSWSPTLVGVCRDEYLRRKAPEHAQQLRDHVMHWRYNEAKALATLNPHALMVRCGYKNNLWQGVEHIVKESALEHAWRTGDENFIELFEELGCKLPPVAFDHREELLTQSEVTRKTIAVALRDYANGGLWGDLWEKYQNAPHWVFGLDEFVWRRNIKTEAAAKRIDIFSDRFRRAPGAVDGGWQGDVSRYAYLCPAAARCLSVKVATAQSSAEHRPVIR